MQGLVLLLAAMAPCIRLYGFLGARLKAAYPHAKHEFSEWVSGYASPAYLAEPIKHERMLGSLSHGRITGVTSSMHVDHLP